MKTNYKNEVKLGLRRTNNLSTELLTEKDIEHLPAPVQRYLRFTGVMDKEKVKNVMVIASGQIRSKPGDENWMRFKSEQYNFFDNPTRLFYINAKKMGIPATGLHIYKNINAIMVIKIAGLFKIVDAKGPKMDQGETVTVFNDMCFMSPATLIDKNIQWEMLDSLHVNARFTNGDITIGARLSFDAEGKLIDFISYDRFESSDGKVYKNYPWRTPVKEYGRFNGFQLPSKAEAIWERPDGDFCYGIFNIEEIRYNVTTGR